MNTVKITGKQQEVCGIITEVNQVILFLLILNLSENFKYKTSITGNNYNVGFGEKGYDATKIDKNETEVVIPLKYLSNFWKSLNIPLINCEVELILTWSRNCVLTDMTEQLKTGFNRSIRWHKYRSQMIVQSNNNNLNYLIDPTFTNVNRLFVLSFTRTNAGNNRNSFWKYHVGNVEMKDFNILIDGKSFF